MTDAPDWAASPLALGEHRSHALGAHLAAARAAGASSVVIWPVGSTEPHGPHLPLATDAILAEHNARLAAHALRDRGLFALVAPTLPYGVTDFAEGFPGAIGIPRDALVALLTAAAARFYADGVDHLCLVNHHLEPGHLDAIAAATKSIAAEHGAHRISAPTVISRRWGGRLGAEFKSGACHAGRYEGSLVLAATPALVDTAAAAALPALDISLSDAIRSGRDGFRAIGMTDAYTGDPAAATAAEGEALYAVLTDMVATTILEALADKDAP